MRRTDSVTRWVVGLALLAATCGSCSPRLVPMAWRPDTRMIWAVNLDTVAINGTLEILQAALPHEGAVCYHGELRDTLFVDQAGQEHPGKIILVHSVTKAVADSANNYHVYFANRHAGCIGAIAVGHSHPYAATCNQSDDDARLLFGDPEALVSLAWCMNGEVELMWQDGRRSTHRWRA